MYTIKKYTTNSPEYQLALKLRYEVLRKPLGLEFTEHELQKDANDVHFGLFKEDHIVASLTLTQESEGKIKMRQVAVAANMQGKGLGKTLALESEKYALETGNEIVYCHARDTAVPFYNKLGYEQIGELFIEVGIPHYKMVKKIG
jgi:predicted GNAT family N-acyltransferase